VNRGGQTTGRMIRELARERHERVVHLVDVEAVRRALLGSPTALTELERGAVIALCDLYGLDVTITAAGLGVAPNTVDWTIRRNRKRLPGLTRDLMAAAMLRPAGELVEAVAAGDADAVAGLLTDLDRQRLAALAVVLASMVADGESGAVSDGRERVAA